VRESKSSTIKSELGWSTRERITVRGKDLPGEILGTLNLGDMAYFELTGNVPNEKQSRLFNAMAVTLVEHGVTPSALAARLTYLGAPEAMQAAVAAGLCGLGSVFVGSMEGAAKLLSEGQSAEQIVAENKRIPGLGHPLHKPVDPRTVRLFEIARETGYYGKYCQRWKRSASSKTSR
jgi:citrate synthase